VFATVFIVVLAVIVLRLTGHWGLWATLSGMTFDPGDEHNLRLGRAVQNSHALEITASWVLAQSLGLSVPLGSIVSNQAGLRGTLAIIRSASERADYPLDAVAVNEWLKLAAHAVTVRNRVIHTPWMQTESGQLAATLHRGWVTHPANPADVDRDANFLMDTALAGQALLKVAG
jgi:hypothetical protein